jgi:hypothetical protein
MIRDFLIIAIVIAVLLSNPGVSYASSQPLKEGNRLPKFTVTEGKKKITFPDDFKGEVFALYFGNLVDNKDGFQFLSWGGGFTIILRQESEVLHDTYFAGIASLKNRPIYWVPLLVKKTFNDSMKKHDIRGDIFYDWDSEIADKLKIDMHEYRAVIVDKKGIIRRVYDCRIYDLSPEEKQGVEDLFKELINEKVDDKE